MAPNTHRDTCRPLTRAPLHHSSRAASVTMLRRAALTLLATSAVPVVSGFAMSREKYPDKQKRALAKKRRAASKMCGKHSCEASKEQFRQEKVSRAEEVDAWLRRGLSGWFLNTSWQENDAMDMCEDAYEDYVDTLTLDEELHRHKYKILEALTTKATQKPVLRRHGINQQEFLFAPLEDGYTYGKAFYGTVADLLEAAPAYTNETAEAAFVRESLGLAAEKKTYNATHRYFSVLDEMTSLPYLRNKTDGVILKPSDGTNSIGVVWVQLLDGQEALQDYWANSARGATEPPEDLESLTLGFRTFAFYKNKDSFFRTRAEMLAYLLREHIPHYHEYMIKTVWERTDRRPRWFVENKVPTASRPPVTWTHRATLAAETSPLEIRVNVMCREVLGFWISIEGNEFDNCVHKNGTFQINSPELWSVLANNWGGLDKNPRKQFEKLVHDVAGLYIHPAEMGNIPMLRFDFFAHPERNGHWHTYNEGVYGIAFGLVRPYEKRWQKKCDEKNGHERRRGKSKSSAAANAANSTSASTSGTAGTTSSSSVLGPKHGQKQQVDAPRKLGWPLKKIGTRMDASEKELEVARAEAAEAAARMVTLDDAARVYYIDNFASELELDKIMETSLPFLEARSELESSTGTVAEVDMNTHRLLRKVELRKQALMGLDNHLAGSVRVRRYKPGNGHPLHTDWWAKYVSPGTPSNLVATLHLFMTDVEKGGGTAFPRVKRMVKAKRGRLAVWWSCDREGRINPMSEHEGMPVHRGVKWTATTFFYNYQDRCMPNVTHTDPVQYIEPRNGPVLELEDSSTPTGADAAAEFEEEYQRAKEAVPEADDELLADGNDDAGEGEDGTMAAMNNEDSEEGDSSSSSSESDEDEDDEI